MGPRQLSQAAWGLASLRHMPSSLWLKVFLTRSRPSLVKVSVVEQHLSQPSLSHILLTSLLQATASDLSRLAWSLARFDRMSRSDPQWHRDRSRGWVRDEGGAVVSEDWAQACWEALHALLLKHQRAPLEAHQPLEQTRPPVSPGQVAALMCALSQTGHWPPEEVFSALLAFLGTRTATMTPTQDCQVAGM